MVFHQSWIDRYQTRRCISIRRIWMCYRVPEIRFAHHHRRTNRLKTTAFRLCIASAGCVCDSLGGNPRLSQLTKKTRGPPITEQHRTTCRPSSNFCGESIPNCRLFMMRYLHGGDVWNEFTHLHWARSFRTVHPQSKIRMELIQKIGAILDEYTAVIKENDYRVCMDTLMKLM